MLDLELPREILRFLSLAHLLLAKPSSLSLFQVEYMSIDSAWAVAPVVFSVVGIVSVSFVISVFVRYNSTPIIMASGRELCYVLMAGTQRDAPQRAVPCVVLRRSVLMAGMLLCYAMTFVRKRGP